eukprot:3146405-Rhodomonas_salina.1
MVALTQASTQPDSDRDSEAAAQADRRFSSKFNLKSASENCPRARSRPKSAIAQLWSAPGPGA